MRDATRWIPTNQQQESTHGSDRCRCRNHSQCGTQELHEPTRALIWFFRKSRDLWKSKYQDLKATVKGYKNRIADLTKSREQWRVKAEQAGERLSALEAEVAGLRAEVVAQELKKKRTREASC